MKQGKLKLRKSHNVLNRMKKRWVVLTTDKLQLYADKTMRKPVLAIWLSRKMVAKKESLRNSDDGCGFNIAGDDAVHSILFCSKSEEECDAWIGAINDVIREWKRTTAPKSM